MKAACNDMHRSRRIFGTEWVEACYSSGHMDLYYLFPPPPTGSSVRWLHEVRSHTVPL